MPPNSSSDDDEKEAAAKRPASDEPDDKEEDSDDGWIGPTLSEAAPAKKKKFLPYENVYLDNLPNGESYERSYMHRDVVSWCLSSGPTGFVVTGSVDGHVKFWKKQDVGIEFVKHFRAHLGSIKYMSINCNGTLMITVSEDKQAKVFDVVHFDMINILSLDYVPVCAAWVHRAGDAIQAVAIADAERIRIYDSRGASQPLKVIERMHMKPIRCIVYNPVYDVAISADQGGMLEYWRGPSGDYDFPKKVVAFDSKVETDLYEFAKHKTFPLSMTISQDGKFLAALGADKKIRIFRFLMGKLYCVIDESLNHYFGVQQSKQMMPAMEFNRKVSNDKELEKSELNGHCNIVFDSSGHFIMYATMIGIKLVNIYTNKVKTIIGKNENLRFIHLALCQNDESRATSIPDMEMQASETLNNANKDLLPDPTLICCAFRKNRLYLLTRRNGDHSNRDVFNERPTHEDRVSNLMTEDSTTPKLFETATIHTDRGDVHCKLFPRECPKTVENFCGLAKNNYYNGCIFHRVIKQFMVQTGDPTGIGTGGESLWGDEFEDEFHPKLKHDRPYTMSMANAGANSNGSQFFMTVVPASWLDNKHTVFGRVVKGMEIVVAISNVKTHPKTDKPYDDIKIVSVTVKDPVKL